MYFHSECTNIIKQNQTSCLEEYPLHYSVFYLHILVLPVFKLHINGIMQNVFLFLNLWFFLLALCLRCTEIDAVAVFHDFHSQVVLMVKNPPANTGDIREPGWIPELGRSPGGGHGTHSSILAWRISWTEEPGELQFLGLKRVGHKLWSDLAQHSKLNQ